MLTIVVLCILFLINLFYLTCYAATSVSIQQQYDPVLNVSTPMNITESFCVPFSTNIQTAQNVLFVLMYITIPLFLRIKFSYSLFKHVKESGSRVIHGRNQQREIYLTRSALFSNGAFLAFNLPIIIYYMIYTFRSYWKVFLSIVYIYQLDLFYDVAYLFSFTFTIGQFLIDFVFNRVFREEMIAFSKKIFECLFKPCISTNQQINRTTDQHIAETNF